MPPEDDRPAIDIAAPNEGVLAAFDRLTRLASRLARAPAAFLILVDAERPRIVSQVGELGSNGLPADVELSKICNRVLVSDAPLVVRDGSSPEATDIDPRVACIGIPLRPASDSASPPIGGMCVLDTSPRDWEDADIEAIAELAESVLTEIELRRASGAADRERQHFRELIDGLDAIVWEVDLRTREATFVSRRAGELLRYPLTTETLHPDFWQKQIVHPDDLNGMLAHYIPAREAGRTIDLAYRVIAADGQVIWIHDRISFVLDKDGRPEIARGLALDVTDRAEITSALAASEQRFRELADGIDAVCWLYDTVNGRMLYVSPAFERIWGRPREEIRGDSRGWFDAIHPEDREMARARLTDPIPGQSFEYRIVRPDEEIRWIEDRSYPIRDESGSIHRIAGVADDITIRRELESQRESAEEHYRRLVANAPYAIYALDESGRITEINPAGEALLGRKEADLIGRHVGEVIAPEQFRRGDPEFMKAFLGDAETVDIEVQLVDARGDRRLVHICSTPIRVEGRPAGRHGIARDITEERAREAEARLLATALQNLDEAVSIAAPDGRIVYANSTHARLFGYDINRRPLPHRLDLAADAEATRQFRESLQIALERGNWAGRLRARRLDDDRIIPVDVIFGRVDVGQRESLILAISRDMSEEIRREEHLRRAERLATVGTLIGGVAHELNNPLNAIINFAMLLLDAEHSPEAREDLETIQHEALRAAKIVADLGLLARQTQDVAREFDVVDLNEVVRHVLRTQEYPLRTRNIEVVEDLDPETPLVRANRSDMEQILINLIVNAAHALEHADGLRRIAVRTREHDGRAVLTVTDSGPGIPVDLVGRIFDPFFTTKAPGEGTGLGLSLVHNIVSEHDGQVSVQSEPGKGAEFRVELPAVPYGAEEASADEPAVDALDTRPARPLRILVVDDEPAIRRTLATFLTRRGHEVQTVVDGAEALRLLVGTAAVEFDVILSDLRMPGLSGDQLLERLRAQGGGLDRRVIFLTGDAASGEAARILAATNAPVLFKPFRLNALARKVERFAEEVSG